MPIAAVLFDKDGTLIDFDATWGPATYAVIHALAKGEAAAIRRQADALQFSLETRRFDRASPLVAGSSASYTQLWADALGRSDYEALRGEIDALNAIESIASLTPIGRPAEVLAELKALGLRLGVATNDSEVSARRQIAALGLGEALEFVAGYDSGHGGKPAPGMVLAFARHLGVAPGEIAMVGDTLHDMRAARAAGAVAIAVLTGPGARRELAAEADHVLDDISLLPRLIGALAARALAGAG